MKKILSITLLAGFLTFGIGASAASASPISVAQHGEYSAASVSPVAQRWGWGRQQRTRYITRTERDGWRMYRVTYRITNFRGRTYSQVVSRVRIR
jgi:hypothetical protein